LVNGPRLLSGSTKAGSLARRMRVWGPSGVSRRQCARARQQLIYHNETTPLSAYGEETTMQRATRACAFALGLGIIAFAAVQVAPQAFGQTGPGWITLLDSKTMGDWDRVGETNWRLEDGAVVADKKTSKGAAFLVSKKSYKDFMLHVEFWASDNANSGIFLRCSDPKKISDRSCYEANIFDQRKDPSYGTGAVTRYVEVSPMPKAGGKWNTYEITIKGRDLTLVLNGKQTAQLHNGMFQQGPIALQHGAGVIKFRKVAIKPL
jgi:3-keto-disaccharide hydrolase